MNRSPVLLLVFFLLIGLLTWSGWHPYDRATWIMEVFPIFVVAPLLVASYRRFPLTNLLYACAFIHGVILLVGGAYTYARVPFGFQMAEVLGLHRNPYDKIGHFAQGFIPAIAAREILLRGNYLKPGKMLAFLVTCVVLAISASYELIEWGSALALGQGADEFLGTQGDPWDTQSDMLFALIGAVVALVTLTGIHDRQIRQLPGSRPV
jgi:putative membrane protein